MSRREILAACARITNRTPARVIADAVRSVKPPFSDEQGIIAQNIERWSENEYLPDYVIRYCEECNGQALLAARNWQNLQPA